MFTVVHIYKYISHSTCSHDIIFALLEISLQYIIFNQLDSVEMSRLYAVWVTSSRIQIPICNSSDYYRYFVHFIF